MSGEMIWTPEPGWELPKERIPFKLEPGQALEIPLRAQIEKGPFPRTPMLTIRFAQGNFRNRNVEVYPFKLPRPLCVVADRAKETPTIDGQLSDQAWRPVSAISLLGVSAAGGRSDQIQFLADEKWLYVAARLDDPAGKLKVQPPSEAAVGGPPGPLGEPVRVVLSDGKQTWTYALTPQQLRYAGGSQPDGDSHPAWKAVAARSTGAWSVEMAIPRQVFGPQAKLQVNVIHRRAASRGFDEYALCPAYVPGPNPDVLPDWKPGDSAASFAQLLFR